MKILILSNQFRSMAVFWRVLIETMIEKGIEPICCAPKGGEEFEKILRDLGAKIVYCKLDRKGLNPIKDIFYYFQLKKIFRKEKPDIVYATTIKPVIYGLSAAAAVGVPIKFAMITGLGYVFEADSFAKNQLLKIAQKMYRRSLAQADGIFFQNRDDAQLFKNQDIIEKNARIYFVNGTGVDTIYFAQAPFPPLPPVIFLLIARLLEAKGIREYAEAAKILKQNFPETSFRILGIPETGPGALPIELIKEWDKDGLIDYLGETRDVRPFIAYSHIAVLPSWREGLPVSLMEAMSMGRPCIATDVPGCKEVVKNGVNGWLCPAKNPVALADAMKKFIIHPDLIKKMGAASRKIVVDDFNAKTVANEILNILLSAYDANHSQRID